MKEIVLTTVLKDLAGKPIDDVIARQSNGNLPSTPPMTLGCAAVHALLFNYPDETLTGEEKFNRADLAHSIHGAKTIALAVEDLALVKKLIGKLYRSDVVYAAWPLLDPAGAENSKKSRHKAA